MKKNVALKAREFFEMDKAQLKIMLCLHMS